MNTDRKKVERLLHLNLEVTDKFICVTSIEGDIYAHDIESLSHAEALLSDIITAMQERGEDIPDGIEIVDG